MGKKYGFTLIELMVVIAVIAVLVTVAVPNYKKFQLRARTAEAKRNLGALRQSEEAYRLENSVYIACPLHPATVPSGTSTTWEATEVPQAWIDLGFSPTGKIRYSYEITAGPTGIDDSYEAKAYGDLDADSTLATYIINQDGNLTSLNPLE